MSATRSYFSGNANTMIFQTTNGFDGTAQTGIPVEGPGDWTFPAQAGGGLYNFHTVPILVRNITYTGPGSCVVSKVIAGVPTAIATLSGDENELFEDTILAGDVTLTFASSGAGSVAIVAEIVVSSAGFGAKGATGPRGPKGDTGRWMGTWSSGTAYVANDIVQYQGSAWINILANTGGAPASTPSAWELFASKGDPGAAGADGTNGMDGTDGLGVPAGGTTGQILAKLSNADNDSDWIDPPSATGTATNVPYFNNLGVLADFPGLIRDTLTGGLNSLFENAPDDSGGAQFVNSWGSNLKPIADATSQTWFLHNFFMRLDPDSSGFNLGTGGDGATLLNMNITHQGTSDTGRLAFLNLNSDIGNGTDPISILGMSFAYGFGHIHDNVTVDGALQGWGFQPLMDTGAAGTNNFNVRAFYDFADIRVPVNGYESATFNPHIAGIPFGHGFSGVNIAPHLDTLDGGLNGINISPVIDTMSGNATGLNVNMSQVTVAPGQSAEVTFQNLHLVFVQVGTFGNTISIETTDTTTAGNEVASLTGGDHIVVTIEAGVTTDAQVKAAIEANFSLNSNVNVTFVGAPGVVQTTQASTPFTGGIDPGTKKAAHFEGDVTINGAFSFTGALSIGALSSYAPYTIVDGGGNPGSASTLITAPTVGDNLTIANADTLGVNTAALITIGNNSHLTTAFLGVAALGLPAVLSMGAGSTIDRVAGAVFALSLDGGATGGTVDTVSLCKATALPNGTTTVNRLYGYEFVLPFGDVGTDIWGFYESPDVHNFFAGDLKIGTGGDTASAGYRLHVEGGGLLVVDGSVVFDASASGLGFFGATVVSQQVSSGPATAGGTYTATEQTMIQEMYNAMRAYGLLT